MYFEINLLKFLFPIKHIPVESFLLALLKPIFKAIFRTIFFFKFPIGNIDFDS